MSTDQSTQPATDAAAGAEPPDNTVNWWEIQVPDLEAGKAFYGAVFGWTTETMGDEPGAITMFKLPGFVGGEAEQPVSREVVAVMMSDPSPRSSWTPDFWVDDVDTSISEAERLGGRAAVGPYDTPVGRMAVMSDPQGGRFTISTIAQVATAREAAGL